MIQGSVIIYNDTPALVEACLKSLLPICDTIIAIDGAFKEFPHDKPYSTDGSLDVARHYADMTIEALEPWKDQATKRNAYLTLRNPRDYYFILDTDETADGMKPADLSEDVYGVKFNEEQDGRFYPAIFNRLIRHQPGIQYQGKHNVLMAGGKLLSYPSPHIETCLAIIVEHRPSLRGTRRLAEDGEYLRTRAENQIKFDFESHIRSCANDRNGVVLRHTGSGYDGLDPVRNLPITVTRNGLITVSEEKARELLENRSDFVFIERTNGSRKGVLNACS
jgi:hypothetical protein